MAFCSFSLVVGGSVAIYGVKCWSTEIEAGRRDVTDKVSLAQNLKFGDIKLSELDHLTFLDRLPGSALASY